ncbi:AEC family transporter [Pseudoglutamicibacter albus]|uniref:Permease n=3 Tax=Pseudoglutamicibacter albus TaxID=98671 RepID=A0ABU1Z0Y8_9MICC|nr:AEC family transporter [Pseudoglutamicibacter albus]MDR7294282.1 putative permease [Pseudoglutamicibacter albus]
MGNVSAMLGVLSGFTAIWVVIVVGYIAGRLNVLGPEGRYVLSRLTFLIANPALLFQTIARADISVIFGPQVFIAAIGAFTVMALYVLIARLALKRKSAELTVGALSASQVNAANLGIPIAIFVLGDATYSVPVLLFQLAILQPLSLIFLDVQTQRVSAGILGVLKGIATNPLILASLAGVIVATTGVSIPQTVMNPIEIIGGAAVPAMLMAFGISLVGSKPLQHGSGRRVDVVLVLTFKLIVHPLIAWLLAAVVFQLDSAGIFMAVILGVLPTAQNVQTTDLVTPW